VPYQSQKSESSNASFTLAVNSAKVTPTLSGDFYARQHFRIQDIIYGNKEIAKEIEIRYSYM
jgi:hypothetical protein